MKRNKTFYLEKDLILFLNFIKKRKKTKISEFLSGIISESKEYKAYIDFINEIESKEPKLIEFKNNQFIYNKGI